MCAAPADGSEPAEEQLAELADRWRRAAADADDLRKRFERRLAEQSRAERARTVLAFLPVLDDLELALRHAQADPAVLGHRVKAAHEQALQVLNGLGFTRVGRIGEPYDPLHHEAPDSPADRNGTAKVTAVLRPGYADNHGTLLRPATVTVAAGGH